MKTKNNILTLLFVLISASFFGQDRHFEEKRDKIKSLKIAFITTELELKPDEASRFWPIYNAHEFSLFELKKQKMKFFFKHKESNNFSELSDKEASLLLSKMESNEEEMFKLQKKLISDLKGVISPIKILKLLKSEDDFNKKLLQQFRNKKR
jgi:hypothetical protein